MEFLIEEGCNVNEQDELGSTPLHYAALTDNYEAVLMLVVLAFERIKLDVGLLVENQISWNIINN